MHLGFHLGISLRKTSKIKLSTLPPINNETSVEKDKDDKKIEEIKNKEK